VSCPGAGFAVILMEAVGFWRAGCTLTGLSLVCGGTVLASHAGRARRTSPHENFPVSFGFRLAACVRNAGNGCAS
jgi:hypothetical protein